MFLIQASLNDTRFPLNIVKPAFNARTNCKAKTVSVILPVYNRFDLLEPVLRGFLKEYKEIPFELIAVDDASDPPISTLFEKLDIPEEWKFILHEQNRGRAAALNTGMEKACGDVLIFCDSDIVPDTGYICDHRSFHQANPSVLSTHLGSLDWGTPPNLFGRLMGARSNPRMHNYTGPVNWNSWFTDNWSFKRGLIEKVHLHFDETFLAWGFEELELARRLQITGVSNTATTSARGLHLKKSSPSSMLANFTKSVPNLLHLAQTTGLDSQIQQWLSFRFDNPENLFRAESCLNKLWERITELDKISIHGIRPGHDNLALSLATGFSEAIFRLGIARGFANNNSTGYYTSMDLPQASDTAQLDALLQLCQVGEHYARCLAIPTDNSAIETLLV